MEHTPDRTTYARTTRPRPQLTYKHPTHAPSVDGGEQGVEEVARGVLRPAPAPRRLAPERGKGLLCATRPRTRVVHLCLAGWLDALFVGRWLCRGGVGWIRWAVVGAY